LGVGIRLTPSAQYQGWLRESNRWVSAEVVETTAGCANLPVAINIPVAPTATVTGVNLEVQAQQGQGQPQAPVNNNAAPVAPAQPQTAVSAPVPVCDANLVAATFGVGLDRVSGTAPMFSVSGGSFSNPLNHTVDGSYDGQTGIPAGYSGPIEGATIWCEWLQ